MNNKEKFNISLKKFIPILLIIATVFMSIGYASLDSIYMNIDGKISAIAQTGIFITDAVVVSKHNSTNSNPEMTGAFLNDSISILPTQDEKESQITYEVKIYNSNAYNVFYHNTIYDVENDSPFYDNQNIIFEVKNKDESSLYESGSILASKDYITLHVTFKYKDPANPPTNQDLNFKIKFQFYTFLYDANGGLFQGNKTTKVETTYPSDNNVLITNESPTRIFNEFLGWSQQKDATNATYSAGQQLDIRNINVLYAVWKSEIDLNTSEASSVNSDAYGNVHLYLYPDNEAWERMFIPLKNLEIGTTYRLTFDYQGKGNYSYYTGFYGYNVINEATKISYDEFLVRVENQEPGFTYFISGENDNIININQQFTNTFVATSETMYLYFEFSNVKDYEYSIHDINNIKIEKIS